MGKALSIGVKSSIETNTEVDERVSIASENTDNALIESIWEELNGRVDREIISQTVLEANTRYQNAAIKTFLPILTRRYVLKMLQESRVSELTRAVG